MTNPQDVPGRRVRRHATAVLALCICVATTGSVGPIGAVPRYHILKRLFVQSGGADFLAVDPLHRRLYGAGNWVVDIDRDTVIGSLPDRSGYGYALAPDLNRGIARWGVIFDLESLAPIARVPAKGDASTYDPATHQAFLFNDTTTAVDLISGSITGRIPLPAAPESGVADGVGHVFVNLLPGSIAVINSRSLKLEQVWPLAPCGAEGLAIDTATHRLFVSCNSKHLLVLDSQSGRLVATVPIPGLADQSAFDPASKLIFNPNGDGTMTLIHEDGPNQYSVVSTVETAEGTRAVAFDSRTSHAFLWHWSHGALTILIIGPS